MGLDYIGCKAKIIPTKFNDDEKESVREACLYVELFFKIQPVYEITINIRKNGTYDIETNINY